MSPPLPPTATPTATPIVIAHRGASGLLPEHTLAAYDLAIDQGADFIEPDLVPTSDGVLVARHENAISETTDIADHAAFAARRTDRTIDGRTVTDWFVEDFTLAELKTIRAKERLPDLRGTANDGRFEIPTFTEIVALAKRRSTAGGRTVGVYPETKHPRYFAAIGLATDPILVEALARAGWTDATAPVFVQSFEIANLRRIAAMTGVRLIQLLDADGGPADGAAPSYAAMATPHGLAAIARYAFGIGPSKAMLRRDGRDLVRDAHTAGLRVHPWTYRAENLFLPPSYRRGGEDAAHGDLAGEIGAALVQGVDGFFTDFALAGVQARDRFCAGRISAGA